MRPSRAVDRSGGRQGVGDRVEVATGDDVAIRWAPGPAGAARGSVLRAEARVLVIALAHAPERPPGRGAGLTIHRSAGAGAVVVRATTRDVRPNGAGCLVVCRPDGPARSLDRRGEPRVAMSVPARILRPGGLRPIAVEVVDVSPGGIALVTTWDAEPGTRLTVSIDDDPAATSDVVVVARDVAAPTSPLQVLRCRFV